MKYTLLLGFLLLFVVGCCPETVYIRENCQIVIQHPENLNIAYGNCTYEEFNVYTNFGWIMGDENISHLIKDYPCLKWRIKGDGGK